MENAIGPVILAVMVILGPMGVMMWVKMKVKGKLLCTFVRKNRSTDTYLCRIVDDFVVDGDRAYEIYPDYVRISRFPAGLPSIFQEFVPHMLYDELDLVPLDWVRLDNRQGRAMELKAALDENFFKKLVYESTAEGRPALGFSLKRALPFGLVALGILGLVILMTL